MVQPGQVPVCCRADNQLYECNANHRNPNSADLIFATVDGAEYFDLTQLFISVALPDAVLPGICVSSQ